MRRLARELGVDLGHVKGSEAGGGITAEDVKAYVRERTRRAGAPSITQRRRELGALVDREFGTGAVKVTPAHDPNDYEIAERHGLPAVDIFTEEAVVNAEGGRFEGLDRYAARREVKAALDELGPKANDVIPIFITLDPERDTPQAVTDYVRNFGQRFVGLTGSPEQVAEAAKAYRVTYSKFQEEGAKPDDYTIDHVALVYLMGKNGEYLTHFAYGTPAAKMAEALRRYL